MDLSSVGSIKHTCYCLLQSILPFLSTFCLCRWPHFRSTRTVASDARAASICTYHSILAARRHSTPRKPSVMELLLQITSHFVCPTWNRGDDRKHLGFFQLESVWRWSIIFSSWSWSSFAQKLPLVQVFWTGYMREAQREMNAARQTLQRLGKATPPPVNTTPAPSLAIELSRDSWHLNLQSLPSLSQATTFELIPRLVVTRISYQQTRLHHHRNFPQDACRAPRDWRWTAPCTRGARRAFVFVI